MHHLGTFGVDDLVDLSASLRGLGADARDMEQVADRVVRRLQEALVDDAGGPACALVRFYKVHPFGQLDAALQAFALETGNPNIGPDTACLTLLATAGHQDAWNDRRSSLQHQAIPLTSEPVISEYPMISRLLLQLGLEMQHVLFPSTDTGSAQAATDYGVFYVAEAAGSEWIPAQEDFVEPFGIRSAVGFGGVLLTGEVFVVMLFTTVSVPPQTADLFRSLAPAVKAAIVPFTFKVFADR